MNKKELFKLNEKLYNTYCGIIFNSRSFQSGVDFKVNYDFNCSQYNALRNKYSLLEIAGEGNDFHRALNITKWLQPRLKHKGDYDNHIECNALSLLEYSLDKQQAGINCLNKAKILEECCLALGIYARRIGLYPCSPYDMDNHVVTEIFDNELQKWIILDPTSGGYFTDGKQPLSCIDIRDKYATRQFITVVLPKQETQNYDNLFKENIEWNAYYAKNFYFITVDLYCGFGEKPGAAWLIPKGFSAEKWFIQNQLYKIETAKSQKLSKGLITLLEGQLENAEKFVPQTGNTTLWKQPESY